MCGGVLRVGAMGDGRQETTLRVAMQVFERVNYGSEWAEVTRFVLRGQVLRKWSWRSRSRLILVPSQTSDFAACGPLDLPREGMREMTRHERKTLAEDTLDFQGCQYSDAKDE